MKKILETTFNLKTGKATVTQDGKTREHSSIVLATMHTGLQQLREFKRIKSSPNPEELEWEIKLYEWILAQPDAEAKAEQYLKARHVSPEEGYILEKREAVKRLGWKID